MNSKQYLQKTQDIDKKTQKKVNVRRGKIDKRRQYLRDKKTIDKTKKYRKHNIKTRYNKETKKKLRKEKLHKKRKTQHDKRKRKIEGGAPRAFDLNIFNGDNSLNENFLELCKVDYVKNYIERIIKLYYYDISSFKQKELINTGETDDCVFMGLQNSYVYHNNNITQSQITNLEITINADPLWIDYNLIHNIFVLDLVIVKLFCIIIRESINDEQIDHLHILKVGDFDSVQHILFVGFLKNYLTDIDKKLIQDLKDYIDFLIDLLISTDKLFQQADKEILDKIKVVTQIQINLSLNEGIADRKFAWGDQSLVFILEKITENLSDLYGCFTTITKKFNDMSEDPNIKQLLFENELQTFVGKCDSLKKQGNVSSRKGLEEVIRKINKIKLSCSSKIEALTKEVKMCLSAIIGKPHIDKFNKYTEGLNPKFEEGLKLYLSKEPDGAAVLDEFIREYVVLYDNLRGITSSATDPASPPADPSPTSPATLSPQNSVDVDKGMDAVINKYESKKSSICLISELPVLLLEGKHIKLAKLTVNKTDDGINYRCDVYDFISSRWIMSDTQNLGETEGRMAHLKKLGPRKKDTKNLIKVTAQKISTSTYFVKLSDFHYIIAGNLIPFKNLSTNYPNNTAPFLQLLHKLGLEIRDGEPASDKQPETQAQKMFSEELAKVKDRGLVDVDKKTFKETYEQFGERDKLLVYFTPTQIVLVGAVKGGKVRIKTRGVSALEDTDEEVTYAATSEIWEERLDDEDFTAVYNDLVNKEPCEYEDGQTSFAITRYKNYKKFKSGMVYLATLIDDDEDDGDSKLKQINSKYKFKCWTPGIIAKGCIPLTVVIDGPDQGPVFRDEIPKKGTFYIVRFNKADSLKVKAVYKTLNAAQTAQAGASSAKKFMKKIKGDPEEEE